MSEHNTIKQINISFNSMDLTTAKEKLSLFGYKCYSYRGYNIVELDGEVLKELFINDDSEQYYYSYILSLLEENVSELLKNLKYPSIVVENLDRNDQTVINIKAY